MMKTMRKFTLIALFVAFASMSVASEKVFFGRWEPPASLAAFWAPVQESWWNPSDNSKLYDYCKSFARKSQPDDLIRDMVIDLKRYPSVPRTFVYSWVIINWPPRITFKLLKPYAKSQDPDLRKIADDFIADIEEQHEIEAPP